jgi:hypothetical protein
MRDGDGAASELSAEIGHTLSRLRAMTDADACADRGAGKWVRKEIVGHLIDSATDNHQRFVRARSGGSLVWPGTIRTPGCRFTVTVRGLGSNSSSSGPHSTHIWPR